MTASGPGVAIVGTGYSALERRSDRPLVLLARDAALAALADAGLGVDAVDGLSTYPVLAPQTTPDTEIITVSSLQTALGLDYRIRWYGEAQEGMAGASVVDAYHALRSGACDVALVWRALHMPKKGRYNAPPSARVSGSAQFIAPYGLAGYNGLFSGLYSRYFDLYGGTREKLAALPVAQRGWANLHPNAVFRDVPLTTEDYLSSRMLTDAMCLFDCDVPIDGASAIVMTTAEFARDLRSPAAYINGIVQGGPNHAELWDLEAVQRSMGFLSDRIWSESGYGPDDIDAAMLYDGFSLFPILWMEALGFCSIGEGLDYIQDGRTAPGGTMPVNTGGGSLSQGRLHGLAHVIEATRQVTAKAGAAQIEGARTALATVAFNMNGMAVIVGSEQTTR